MVIVGFFVSSTQCLLPAVTDMFAIEDVFSFCWFQLKTADVQMIYGGSENVLNRAQCTTLLSMINDFLPTAVKPEITNIVESI